jgi:archaellin
MIKKALHLKVLVAAVAALVVAAGAYAFTAANTVPATTAGAGSGAVSGYTVTNLHYNLNATTPVNIDSLTFTVSPVIPSTSSGKVLVQAVLSTGGPNSYTCTTTTTGDIVTCATTSPQLTADKLTSVTVVAAQ